VQPSVMSLEMSMALFWHLSFVRAAHRRDRTFQGSASAAATAGSKGPGEHTSLIFNVAACASASLLLCGILLLD
jgi:hypothetical protein